MLFSLGFLCLLYPTAPGSHAFLAMYSTVFVIKSVDQGMAACVLKGLTEAVMEGYSTLKNPRLSKIPD